MKRLLIFIFLLFSFNVYPNTVDEYIAEKVLWDNPEVAITASDYLVGGMIALPYFYTLKGEDKTRKTATALFIHTGNWLLTDTVKMRTKRLRPNKENDRSFFSGHTSTAFTSAGLMCAMKEHCTESLIAAAAAGYLRMAGGMHWGSDVLVGATLGYFQGRYIPTLLVTY